ncbi:MAG TPA: histidine kinase [Thermoanaerobaculia bacterium]
MSPFGAALRGPLTRSRLFWAFQLVGWSLFGAGMFVAGVSVWPVAYTAVLKSSLAVFGFAVSLLLRVIYRWLARRGVPQYVLFIAALPLSYGAAGAWMAAHHLVVAAYVAWQQGKPELATRGFPDFVNTIYYFFVLVAWSVLYFGVQAYLDLMEERENLQRAEALAHEARLRALRLQLNPHFLFNALNAISTLVSESRTAEANRMLSRLADFLRTTLDRPEANEIPLADEVVFARRYLEIEEVRFGERLHVDIAVTPEASSALVPTMILQPLVENAVRHAILPREGGGTVAIVAERQDGWLTLGVHDDGPGLGDVTALSHGVGLSNTSTRLTELYGDRAEMCFARSDRGGLAVLIRLPFRAPAAKPA